MAVCIETMTTHTTDLQLATLELVSVLSESNDISGSNELLEPLLRSILLSALTELLSISALNPSVKKSFAS